MTLIWKHCNLPNKMVLLQIAISTKYQRINTQPMKIKTKKIHSHIKIHNEHLKNINKIEKYKKLNMTGRKTDMNITKIKNYKKLNMKEHKTDTNIDRYKN